MHQHHKIQLLAPANGEVLAIEKTADPVFSAKTMGEGFGLEPPDGRVVSPVDGTVSVIADTKHAVGITTPDGMEVLIHMGVDTVSLKGEGFTISVKKGQTVKAGEQIAQMDLKTIEGHKLGKTILVAVTNSGDKLENMKVLEGPAKAGGAAATACGKSSKKGSKKKDYDALAKTIVENVGGKNNIASVIHCITRLRFSLKNEAIAKDDVLKNTDGIIDVLHAGGQYQIVIGDAVPRVYDSMMKILGPGFGENDGSVQTTQQSEGKNPVGRAFGNLIGFITGSMSPVIGVIAASGIIKGILALLTLPQLGSVLNAKSTVYIAISAMADSAFYFLPILVGFAAAKRLGSDPIVAAVIGGVLAYPQIVTWGKAFKLMFSIGGFNFQFLNYTYSIFPMILAAWMAKKLGGWLKEHLPSYLQMIFNPLITILCVSTVTLVITGPIIQEAANGIANFINWLVHVSGWAGGLLIGGFYQILVIFGLHWGVIPLVAQQIAGSGESALNAVISATMVSQGAAVLAVAIKSRKDNMKELGFAAAISAFCGVTEPAIYGINLRYRKVFVSGLFGSAVGGFITGLMHGSMFGFTGSLIGFSSFFNTRNPGDLNSFYAFLLSSAAAVIVSFVATWVWGYNDNMTMEKKVEKKKRPGTV